MYFAILHKLKLVRALANTIIFTAMQFNIWSWYLKMETLFISKNIKVAWVKVYAYWMKKTP